MKTREIGGKEFHVAWTRDNKDFDVGSKSFFKSQGLEVRMESVSETEWEMLIYKPGLAEEDYHIIKKADLNRRLLSEITHTYK